VKQTVGVGVLFMFNHAKDRWKRRADVELVMQGYVIVAILSTSGWDALMLTTLLLLGILTVREIAIRVAAIF